MVDVALRNDLQDGLWFGDVKTHDLEKQGPYGGYSFDCAFQIGPSPRDVEKINKLSRIRIDVGFGDALLTVPAKHAMRSILDESDPVCLSVYPLEWIFAEKLEALFSRGSANSRAKDIYDMALIFPKCTDHRILLDAIHRTFRNRGTLLPDSFQQRATTFNLSILRAAWGSVTLADSSSMFDTAWQSLMRHLANLDSR